MLLNGRLYKKISKDDERVVFYYTPFDSALLASAESEQGANPKDVIFENAGGEYLYTVKNRGIAESRFDGVAFTPPRTPDLDSLDQGAARKLYQDYICSLYEAFSGAREYKAGSRGYVFKRGEKAGNPFRAEAEGFVLTGKIVSQRQAPIGRAKYRFKDIRF